MYCVCRSFQPMALKKLVKSLSSGLGWSKSTSLMLITLEYNVSGS